MRNLRVFFDGGCPVCKREIGLYQRADKQRVIDWCDVSLDSPATALPLPREALLARFHVQTPNGMFVSGARAFIVLWRELPNWKLLARIVSLPGIPSLLEFGYSGFLRLRPRLQRAFSK